MQEKTGKIRIGYWNLRPTYIQVLMCADDILIIANSEAELQRAVIEWASACTEREIEINASKSKMLHSTKRIQRKLNIELEGERKKWSTLHTSVRYRK
jgi:hypothetical protein